MDEKITVRRDGETIRIHIPMKFKRRGGRKEIIVPENLPAHPPGRTAYQRPLVVALVRAHQWKRLLEEGRIPSISVLAKRLKVDRAYVSRLLHLALLAPDIVEAILGGKEPSGLSLARLNKAFPLEWEKQRRDLGFAAVPRVAQPASPRRNS
jgi:hypothetical protein